MNANVNFTRIAFNDLGYFFDYRLNVIYYANDNYSDFIIFMILTND